MQGNHFNQVFNEDELIPAYLPPASTPWLFLINGGVSAVVKVNIRHFRVLLQGLQYFLTKLSLGLCAIKNHTFTLPDESVLAYVLQERLRGHLESAKHVDKLTILGDGGCHT